MVAKWQQWMPFYIDAFMGSPAVQAMHPTARIGYLCLLARAWQTEDCTIPADDDLTLSDMSSIGDELWKVHRDRILKKFDPVDGSAKLRNAVLYEKCKDARRIFYLRAEAAKRRNTRPASAIEDWTWEKTRLRIFERDNYTCQHCGAREVSLECDHLVPISRGGSNEDDNLVASCRSCNQSKRDNLVGEWKPGEGSAQNG